MRASHQFITEKFREFNRIIFNGSLPDVRIAVSNARTRLGYLKYVRLRPGQKPVPGHYTLAVSRYYDLDRFELEDTLIHEMIHLYLHWNGINDPTPHGPNFIAMMKSVNRRHRRRITVSSRTTEQKAESDTNIRMHYLTTVRLRGGERTITVCARTRIFEFDDMLGRMPEVESREWYVSTDPWFNRYPSVRTLKLYKVPDQEKLDSLLATAIRCEIAGKIFSPIPPGTPADKKHFF